MRLELLNFGKRKIELCRTRRGKDVIVTWRNAGAKTDIQADHARALRKYKQGKLVEAQ